MKVKEHTTSHQHVHQQQTKNFRTNNKAEFCCHAGYFSLLKICKIGINHRTTEAPHTAKTPLCWVRDLHTKKTRSATCSCSLLVKKSFFHPTASANDLSSSPTSWSAPMWSLYSTSHKSSLLQICNTQFPSLKLCCVCVLQSQDWGQCLGHLVRLGSGRSEPRRRFEAQKPGIPNVTNWRQLSHNRDARLVTSDRHLPLWTSWTAPPPWPGPLAAGSAGCR